MSIFSGGGMGGIGRPRRAGDGRRVGCGSVIGLAIIAIGIISYYSKTSVNPVTGEKQRVSLTPEQETRLGLSAAPQLAQQMGGAVDPRHPDAAAVKRIGAFLVANSIAKDGPYEYHFHLLNDERTVNAFALPGGQVFITRALYNRLPDEAALAGVLGHEIGHVINRHSAEHMAKGELGQMIVTGVGVAASDQGGNTGMTAAMIANVANQVIQAKYGRNDERESDEYGLRIMTSAGFDPTAMIDVMKVLAEESKGGGGVAFLQTHPHPEQRMELIERWIREHPEEHRKLTRGQPLR